MFQFKTVPLLLLALLLALSFVGCTDNEPVDEPIEEPPVEEPAYEEEEGNGYVLPEPPVGEIDDAEDIDWSLYPVIIDGVGIPGASLEMIGEDEIFPTHVSLMALDSTLGMDVFWNLQTDEASLTGLNGFVTFNVGSADFVVEGETITLGQESVRIDDEIYVPIQFFRDVFGAGSAYFSGGHVFIHTQGGDME